MLKSHFMKGTNYGSNITTRQTKHPDRNKAPSLFPRSSSFSHQSHSFLAGSSSTANMEFIGTYNQDTPKATNYKPMTSMNALLLAALLPPIAHGFVQPQTRTPFIATSTTQRTSAPAPRFMSADDDDDIDPNSLGDWRAFRMNLANTGLSDSQSSSSSIDGIDLEEQPTESSSATAASDSAAAPSAPSRPKSVSKKNEELLNDQSAVLAEEYLTGVWAHESAVPEVGGLVCRMPLEAEIHRQTDSAMHKMLNDFLDSDDYDRTEDALPNSLSSSASTGGAAAASASNVGNTKGIIERSTEDSAPTSGDEDDSFIFSPGYAKTVFWYRGAEKLLRRELVKITSSADANGRIEPGALDDASLELLQLYMDNQQTWQSVCLVTERDERTGSAKTLTINRPMAFKLSKSMGRLVLLGAYEAEAGESNPVKTERDGSETQNIVKFLTAFEQQCGVYVGGPDGMEQPATLIHGIDGLPGAVEISPGTGIYKGGLEAAMDGVLSGKYKPLDFRFFIGHTSYAGGELDEAVSLGKWQPVACSRPLVLKQCIQLPKPLWHEVLEFAGGELREISKLELVKRDDLN